MTERPVLMANGRPTACNDEISVVICAHNAASRLPETLAHLQAQEQCEGLSWEVIVVDNGSTDDTRSVALSHWQREDVPLRVVSEPQLGTAHARLRGLAEARHELLAFVDDDNWLSHDWVGTAIKVMRDHPTAGACGGLNEPHYELAPPPWLPAVVACLAIGPQGEPGDVTDSRGLLWTAGIVIRRSAWRQALEGVGMPTLAGREGRSLVAGEDSELSLALRLAGWRLWYDPRLTLKHCLPAGRLTWRYIRSVHGGSGAATPVLDRYHVALRHRGPWTFVDRFRWSWQWQALHSIRRLARHPFKLFAAHFGWFEGDGDVLELDAYRGRLAALVWHGASYRESIRELVSRVSHGDGLADANHTQRAARVRA